MVRKSGWIGAFVVIGFLFAVFGVEAQQQAPAQQPQATAPQEQALPGMDPIMAYAGVWKIETDHFDTPYSKMSHESSTVKNVCWRSGGYVACNQMVNGESRPHEVVLCEEVPRG